MFLENEADYILHGHAQDLDDISLMGAVLTAVKDIVAGNISEDSEYEWQGGIDRKHPFKVDRYHSC